MAPRSAELVYSERALRGSLFSALARTAMMMVDDRPRIANSATTAVKS